MKVPKLSKNEVLGQPKDSVIYVATVPRLSMRLSHVLKTFVPKQQNLEKLQQDLQSYLIPASVRVAQDAYRIGAAHIETTPNSLKEIELKNASKASAILASHQVTNATAIAFGLKYSIYAGMSKKHAQSSTRSEAISQHEMNNNFYRGLRYGWSLNKISRKRSFTSSEHDKDDICDDNEDAGAIDVDDTFPSGDFEPLYHFGCECTMILVR